MKTKRALLVGLALICLLASAGCSPQPESESELAELAEPEVEQQREQQLEQAVATRPDGFLPKVFDFREYLALYGKQYLSPAEFLNRMRLFFARAYRVFIRGVQFLYGRTLSFFALNEMSDWTDVERRSTLGSGLYGDTQIESASIAPVDMGELTEDLKALRMVEDEETTKNVSRTKRDTEQENALKWKEKTRCESPEGCRRGRRRGSGSRSSVDEHIYLDYRESNCIAPVRKQGKCGCCYIFVPITLYEYHHCVSTGRLVEFSEQYLLDCGRARRLDGCDGGQVDDVGAFINDFGLELRDYYSYKAKERTCPYNLEDRAQIPMLGHTRVQGQIVARSWDELSDDMVKGLLASVGPIGGNVRVTGEFLDYGGGVDSLSSVQYLENHSMVIVGYGKQDGRNFWLMRNTHGPGWGLAGYYKLDMDSLQQNLQVLFWLHEPTFQLNPRHDRKKVKKMLAKHESSFFGKLIG